MSHGKTRAACAAVLAASGMALPTSAFGAIVDLTVIYPRFPEPADPADDPFPNADRPTLVWYRFFEGLMDQIVAAEAIDNANEYLVFDDTNMDMIFGNTITPPMGMMPEPDELQETDGFAEAWAIPDGLADAVLVVDAIPPFTPGDALNPANDEDAALISAFTALGRPLFRPNDFRPVFRDPDGEAVWRLAQREFRLGQFGEGQLLTFQQTLPSEMLFPPVEPGVDDERELVFEAIEAIERNANIIFVQRNPEPPSGTDEFALEARAFSDGSISFTSGDTQGEPDDDAPWLLFVRRPTEDTFPLPNTPRAEIALSSGAVGPSRTATNIDNDFDDITGDGLPDFLDLDQDGTPDGIDLTNDPNTTNLALFPAGIDGNIDTTVGGFMFPPAQAGPPFGNPPMRVNDFVANPGGNDYTLPNGAVLRDGALLLAPALDGTGIINGLAPDGLPDVVDRFSDPVAFPMAPTTINTPDGVFEDLSPDTEYIPCELFILPDTTLQDRVRNIGDIVEGLLTVLGFDNEIQRPDRDNFVDVNFENIIPMFRETYIKRDPADLTDPNILIVPRVTDLPLDADTGQPIGVAFDFDSLLMRDEFEFVFDQPTGGDQNDPEFEFQEAYQVLEEDVNGNGMLDPGEDLNGNGTLDDFADEFPDERVGQETGLSFWDREALLRVYGAPQDFPAEDFLDPCRANIIDTDGLDFQDILVLLSMFQVCGESDNLGQLVFVPAVADSFVCGDIDFNFDGAIDFLDLIEFVLLFQSAPSCQFIDTTDSLNLDNNTVGRPAGLPPGRPG